jgi:hypothetical protein
MMPGFADLDTGAGADRGAGVRGGVLLDLPGREVVEYDIPVPGTPTVVVTPRRELAVTRAPRTPALNDIDFEETVKRTPGMTLNDLRIRKPMYLCPLRQNFVATLMLADGKQ